MADTADLRSEGKCSTTPQALLSRQARLDRIKSDVCISCGITAVKNRTVCYACSEKQGAIQRMYGFRAVLRNNGIEDFDAAADMVQRVSAAARVKDDTIDALIKALRSAGKPRRESTARIRPYSYKYKPRGKNPRGPQKRKA